MRYTKILILTSIVLILVAVSGCEKINDNILNNSIDQTQDSQNIPMTNSTQQDDETLLDLDLTQVYGCIEDSDCVIDRGVCGTDVYNKNWNWSNPPEELKNWAQDELEKINGIMCEVGIYAHNPRCEDGRCNADYTNG